MSRPVEQIVYRLAGVDANESFNWRTYAAALIALVVLAINIAARALFREPVRN